jgi:hypothetical protein
MTSSIKWPWNASSTSIPCFLNNPPPENLSLVPHGLLLVIPLLVWYFVSSIDNCILDTVHQFSIRYDGGYMLSTVSILVICLHNNKSFLALISCFCSFNLWMYASGATVLSYCLTAVCLLLVFYEHIHKVWVVTVVPDIVLNHFLSQYYLFFSTWSATF